MQLRSTIVAVALALLTATGALAQANNDPPPAGAILDLNGTPIPSSYQLYTVDFTANVANTAITFAFRDDPAFINFSDPTVADLTTSSGDLLLDSTFSSIYTDNGNSSVPIDWTYANQYGATFGGVVNSSCGISGENCWVDGAVQAYDALSQTIGTTIGNVYQISFYACCGSGGNADFSSLSTNGDTTDTGGNGIDLTAYAQAGLPPPGGTATPEPASFLMLGTGLLGVAFLSFRRQLGF